MVSAPIGVPTISFNLALRGNGVMTIRNGTTAVARAIATA